METKPAKKPKPRPCKNRRRETRDGVTMDWCYAIGCEKVGDMPCVYCVDWGENGEEKSKKSKAQSR